MASETQILRAVKVHKDTQTIHSIQPTQVQRTQTPVNQHDFKHVNYILWLAWRTRIPWWMGSRLFSRFKILQLQSCEHHECSFSKCSHTVRNHQTKENRATSKDVAWTRSAARGPIHWSLLLFSFHESHIKLLPWITPCVPPSCPFDQTHTRHSQTTDTHKLVWHVHSTSAYPVCLLFQKKGDETGLKTQSPAAPSSHPDCPQPALSPRPKNGTLPVVNKQRRHMRGTPSFLQRTQATRVQG